MENQNSIDREITMTQRPLRRTLLQRWPSIITVVGTRSGDEIEIEIEKRSTWVRSAIELEIHPMLHT